ncbi:AAA family ATPase [Candidatus Woesearchaeota archaeon]|nr:AAA family ATPase [Candidatus Woesearchaeota archaeon]
MATWYQQLGFRENPLDVRPNPLLVGLERQEEQLVNHVLKGEIAFLNGLTGSGKSSLLMRVQKNLKNHKFVYLDAQELPKDFNLQEELKKKRSFFDRLRLRKHPTKTPVLIIDEFQATDKDLILDARAKWENPDERKIKSIIIAQISKYLKNVTPAFKERLGSRTLVLPTLDDVEMKEILNLRLKRRGTNYFNKLHNEAINLIVAAADGNPRKLLEYTDMIFDFHYRKFKHNNPLLVNPTYLVTYWGAKEILELKKVNVNAYVYLEKEDKKRKLQAFEKRFNKPQREWLVHLMTGSKTINELARHFKISKSTAFAKLKELKDKGAVVKAGKKRRKQLWQASPHVKRLRVRV